MSNPLLESYNFPPFSQISADHIVPAITQLTERNLTALEQQLGELGTVTWQSLIEPIEDREEALNRAWSTVSHLNAVVNTEELRKAYQQALAILTPYSTAIGQNSVLCEAYKKLAASDNFATLSQSQRKHIENTLRDFRLSGVDLPDEKKQRFADIQQRLSELSNQFSNNVLDATQGWFKHVTDEAGLQGIAEGIIEAAKAAAQERQLEGWVLTLDGPIYMSVMTQAASGELREEMYRAYMTKASDQGPCAGKWDNSGLMDEILSLRQEKAKLLGFDNYAELSIAAKMAETTDQVIDFLTDLADKSRSQAKRELDELSVFAKQNFDAEHLEVWDIPYYSERMKEQQYAVSQEALRPYFPLSKVLNGLFDVASKLFDVTICEIKEFDRWHEDVRFFEIKRGSQTLAHFYLDAFARAGKRGGAWKATCCDRRRSGQQLHLPVAYLVCNFNGPVGDRPGLLTHSDVTTLFHEFGHGLHHMLTQIDVAPVSGINGVEWDAVELPSQFLENWCWQPEVLKSISSHYQTGEILPDELLDKLLLAKNFQSALFTVRQLEFGLFDFRLHLEFGRENFGGVQSILDEVRQQVAVIEPPSFNRFQHGFSHIFAGGYAAGYYSYMWALVLSADAFSAFEESSIFDPTTGTRFLNEILERGGSEPAMTLFKRFRGRAPDIAALLRHSGIGDAA